MRGKVNPEIKLTIGELARRKGIRFASGLAEATGLSYPTANGLFNDEPAAGITFDALAALCRVLEAQPGDLLHYEPVSEDKP